MAKINTAKTFSNKSYSTEEFVKNLVNLPDTLNNLIDSNTSKIHETLLPSSEFDNLLWKGPNEYNEKDLVYFDGRFYVSQGNNNIGNQPDISVTYWKEYTVEVVRIATDKTLGQVMVDGSNGIEIDSFGMLSLNMSTALKIENGSSINLEVNSNDKLTATIVVSEEEANAVELKSDGLYVGRDIYIVETVDLSSALNGKLYYEKSTGLLKYFNGSSFIIVNNDLVSGTASENNIKLVLKDGKTVNINTSSLVKTGNTDSLELKNVSGTVSGNIKLDPQSDNQIKITPGGGLYVPSFGDASALYCYRKEFTRLDDEEVSWSDEVMTVTHNMSTLNILGLQVRHHTDSGYRFYNSFSPYMVDNNTFQIVVPSAFDLSDGTWEIFAPMLLETSDSEDSSEESSEVSSEQA